MYEYLTKRGFQPKLNVMDNQCSKTIQTFIKKNGAKIQLVNPDDHRVNAAERAIQTWKNHWLSGLGTLDPNCPLQLWCQFIEQGQDTLNMRIISRINNRLSAYAILDGQFEFDKTPLFSWIQKREHHGIHMQWMRGMSGQPKSITETSSFTSPKRKDTK